ncbi:ribosomal protein S16 [Fistulina hepatica ATCC 64428]|uniref:Ribosomal protein S16 n=1 Tax=Fistulina hepatica ATCC 64428 TaxID=1128425 RepID=A0A0D7AHD2_9AGAR|nr:ribosomal protein S16 [Fistulina hepatica ATCC 64428]
MPMRIRLSMQGNKNSKFFHIVAIPHTKRRDAKPTELLGIYDPRVKPGVEHRTVHWSVDRIRYWLSVGAVPSDRVVKLLEMVSSDFVLATS